MRLWQKANVRTGSVPAFPLNRVSQPTPGGSFHLGFGLRGCCLIIAYTFLHRLGVGLLPLSALADAGLQGYFPFLPPGVRLLPSAARAPYRHPLLVLLILCPFLCRLCNVRCFSPWTVRFLRAKATSPCLSQPRACRCRGGLSQAQSLSLGTPLASGGRCSSAPTVGVQGRC